MSFGIEKNLWLYPKDTKDNKEHNLKKVPISVVSDLEENQLSRPERVHSLIKRSMNT